MAAIDWLHPQDATNDTNILVILPGITGKYCINLYKLFYFVTAY